MKKNLLCETIVEIFLNTAVGQRGRFTSNLTGLKMSLIEILFLYYVGGYSLKPHQLLIMGDFEYFGNIQIKRHSNSKLQDCSVSTCQKKTYCIKSSQQVPKICSIICIFKMQHWLITSLNKVR